MNRILVSVGALTGGLLLCASAWSGYSQEHWINQQNQAIAHQWGQTAKQHSNPLWGLLGVTGSGLAIAGGASLKFNNDSEPIHEENNSFHPQISPSTPPKNTQWLEKFLNSHCHLAINGVTGSGKTTLAEHALGIWGTSEIFLIDPKFNPLDPAWTYIPQCDDIESVLAALGCLEKRLRARQQNEEEHTPLAIVIDELDWICLTYKTKAINSIRKLYKVGRSLGFRILLCGQSPYAKTLDGSDWKNFNRVVLGNEAVAFCSNPQFPFSKEKYYPKCVQLHQNEKRFGLWIPVSGDPFVREVPIINPPIQPSFSLTPERSPELSEREDNEWLNDLLGSIHGDFERSERWQARDPLNASEPSPEAIGMVVSLYRSGCTKQDAIEYVWKCKKGGSKAYKKAAQHYDQILNKLGAK